MHHHLAATAQRCGHKHTAEMNEWVNGSRQQFLRILQFVVVNLRRILQHFYAFFYFSSISHKEKITTTASGFENSATLNIKMLLLLVKVDSIRLASTPFPVWLHGFRLPFISFWLKTVSQTQFFSCCNSHRMLKQQH